MSLEKALEANTAAVLANAEALGRNTAILVELAELKKAKNTSESQPAPKKQEEKVSAPSKATRAPAAETPASTAAKSVAATNTSLTYDDIKTPFLELAKRDLAAAQALIAEFGFKTLKDAKPEQYGDILLKLSVLAADSEEGMA